MREFTEEVPLFFRGAGDYDLFGILHRPAVEDGKPAFVFCHPLGEEKLWAHRVFVSYARRLAALGYPVLRFDLMGNGDSGGQFSEMSIESACADVRRAIDRVRDLTGVPAVSLLGLRLGATLASIVAESCADIRQLILWAPVVDGAAYMQELLRTNVMTQMAVYKQVRQERPELVAEMQNGRTVNVDGYEMAWALYSSVSALKLAATERAFSGPCLIVQVDKQARPPGDLQRLAASYSSATLLFAEEEPFWKEIATFYQDAPNLFALTNEWLEIPNP